MENLVIFAVKHRSGTNKRNSADDLDVTLELFVHDRLRESILIGPLKSAIALRFRGSQARGVHIAKPSNLQGGLAEAIKKGNFNH